MLIGSREVTRPLLAALCPHFAPAAPQTFKTNRDKINFIEFVANDKLALLEREERFLIKSSSTNKFCKFK